MGLGAKLLWLQNDNLKKKETAGESLWMLHCSCARAEPQYTPWLKRQLSPPYSPKPFGRKDHSQSQEQPFWKRRHCGARLKVKRAPGNLAIGSSHRGALAHGKPWKVWKGTCWGWREARLAGHPQSSQERRQPRSS